MSNANDFVIENGILTKYNGSGGDVIIPDGVTSIGDLAFFGCIGLTNVTIPDGVTSIGSGTFEGCSGLTSVTIPEGVTSIDDLAFFGCEGLTNVTIPDGVTIIKSGTFSGCIGLTNVTIPDGVTSIGSGAFGGCRELTSVTIPESVTSIGQSAFYGCVALKSVTLPEGLKSLGHRAFASCKALETAYLPESLEKIGFTVFSGCPDVKIHTNAGSYAEKFLTEQDDDPTSRKERKFQEWRKFFYFSMRSDGAYVKGCYVDTPIIYLPDQFGKSKVKYAKDALPEDMICLCNADIFQKLPASNKYATARAVFVEPESFTEQEQNAVLEFAKKNQTKAIIFFAQKNDFDTIRHLFKLKKLTQSAMDKLLDAVESAEARMVLLSLQNEYKMQAVKE